MIIRQEKFFERAKPPGEHFFNRLQTSYSPHFINSSLNANNNSRPEFLIKFTFSKSFELNLYGNVVNRVPIAVSFEVSLLCTATNFVEQNKNYIAWATFNLMSEIANKNFVKSLEFYVILRFMWGFFKVGNFNLWGLDLDINLVV